MRSHGRATKSFVVVFTAVFVILAAFNFARQWKSDNRTDGVHWIFSQGNVLADEVPDDSAAFKAGIRQGDILRSINFRPVTIPQDVGRIIRDSLSTGKPLQYEIIRGTESQIVLLTPARKLNNFYFYLAGVGFIILCIGVFAFLRGKSRSFAMHFYFLCLAFFGAYAFSPTGKLDALDW